MKSKKLIPRVLATITTIAIMLTSTPLTTFAEGGGSGGGEDIGSGAAGHVAGADYLNDENIGIRISLVTLKDGNPKVVRNRWGTYYLDIWDVFWDSEEDCWKSMVPSYEFVNGETRYPHGYDTDANGLPISAAATDANVKQVHVMSFDSAINSFYDNASYVNLQKLLQPSLNYNMTNAEGATVANPYWIFTEWGNAFSVSGQNFYNYFMETGGNIGGVDHSVYALVMNYVYSGCLTGLNDKNTFMVVEPVMSLCNVSGTSATSEWNTTGSRYVSSWYGYLEHNIKANRDPGRGHAVRNRLKKLGNEFRLAFTAHTNDPAMRAKIQEVLGVSIATDADLYQDLESASTQWFGYGRDTNGDGILESGGCKTYNNIHQTVGLGMQAFWLSGTIDSGKPIDTYDITSNPQPQNIPTPPETPSDENQTTGTKSVIKLYADLYRDANTNYYTEIVNTAVFIETNTANLVTLSDEEPINGYKLSAWYTSDKAYSSSNTADNSLLKATNMMSISNIADTKSDGKVSLDSLGGKQLRINSYQAAYTSSSKAGYNILASANGGQKYFSALSAPHGGTNGAGLEAQTTTNATNYTSYKRLDVIGESNYGSYEYKVNEDGTVVDLGDAETIVLLYTRLRTHISTSDLTTDETIPDNPDERIDKSGPLTIVKLYGVINPNTYEITQDPSKSSVVAENATRNVNINSESGYTFAEWIYTTQGDQIVLTVSEMGETNLGTVLLDTTLDQAYRLDGFVDGFKNNINLARYFRFLNGTTLQQPAISVVPSSSGVNNNATAGRYSYGSRSGIGTGSYNSTLYLGGDKLADKTPDETDTNDVLYLLFLKTDQLSYSADDLVIPESYITRYDNYKHNPMTVTGSVSGVAYEEYLQAHKFKYILPVVTTASEYIDVNPLFMPHIAKPSGLYFFALLQ